MRPQKGLPTHPIDVKTSRAWIASLRKAQNLSAPTQCPGCIIQPVGLLVQVVAYPHYPYQLQRGVPVVKHTATPHPGYPGRGMQHSRVACRWFAAAKLHVIQRLADKPVIGLFQMLLYLIFYNKIATILTM